MRTLALILIPLLILYAIYECVVYDNYAALMLIPIWAIAFVIIATPTKKIKEYDKKSWMNR